MLVIRKCPKSLKLIHRQFCSLQKTHKKDKNYKKLQEANRLSIHTAEVCVFNSWLCMLVPSRLQLLWRERIYQLRWSMLTLGSMHLISHLRHIVLQAVVDNHNARC